MQWNHDDPRLTAYALGELEGREREAMEELLKTDEAARQAVEEIRAMAEVLNAGLAEEPGPGLTEARKRAIEAHVESGAPAGNVYSLRKLAVAAALLIVFGTGFYFTLSDKGPDAAGDKLEETLVADASGAPRMHPAPRLRGGVRYRDQRSAESLRRGREPSPKAGSEAGKAVFSISETKAMDRFLHASIHSKPGAVIPGDTPYRGPAGNVPPNIQPADCPTPSPVSTPQPGYLSPGTSPVINKIRGVWKLPGEERGYRTRGAYNEAERPHNTEAYDRIVENAFKRVTDDGRSTFSIDVDTAAYANMRRFLNQNMLPPRGLVRIEEFINYFTYNYADPIDEHPFSAHVEVAGCPWKPGHRLVRVGLKGRDVPRGDRPASNLVFLLDVSGSMSSSNKLPLVRQSMKMLVEQLDERDRVAIVVYAGASGMVLSSTPCNAVGAIRAAIDNLHAGGSTNGGAGIQLAYRVAVENFIKGGVNRVVLCTDGDFNVGVTDQSELIRLVEKNAKTGVFLTVLGFGMGNYKDSTLEKLADKGNGNYAYVDSQREARKVLVDEMAGTLITIAKDVKIRIEFNLLQVAAYRLLGYENRILAHQDFKDDTKDAGEIGSGHTVTALYEIIPAGHPVPGPEADPLKYQERNRPKPAAASGELLTLKLRYKQPDGKTSTEMKMAVTDHGAPYSQASRDFKFAASVAAYAMLLRDSKYKGNATYDQVLELAEEGKGADPNGHRAEFLALVRKAKTLKR